MNYRKSEAEEASRAQFRGVWAAITTPFTPDDTGDLPSAPGLASLKKPVTIG